MTSQKVASLSTMRREVKLKVVANMNAPFLIATIWFDDHGN
jgi:hypothetical protein